jgi:AbrB family looped-hinge helix DNA binding protein
MKQEERPAAMIVQPLRDGQITIPAEFREELGITEASLIQITLVEGELRLKPVRPAEAQEGSAWLRELYEYFAPVRQEAIERGYSEEEINADIDAAVRAVRAQQNTSATEVTARGRRPRNPPPRVGGAASVEVG